MSKKTGYIHSSIRPRWRKILLHWNSLFAFASLVLYIALSCIRSPWAPDERATIGDVADAVLDISGFGFAIAITAVALVLALPQNRLLRTMMLNSPDLRHQVKTRETPQGIEAWREGEVTDESLKKEGTVRSNFSHLIFLFTWTALAQVFAALTAFVVKLFAGPSVVLTKDDPAGLVAGALLTGCVIYAIAQLIVAVVTVAQIADLQEVYFKHDVTYLPGKPDKLNRSVDIDEPDGAMEQGVVSKTTKKRECWWARGWGR